MSAERCNQCGGPLAAKAGDGLVPLLACENCGREVPAGALGTPRAEGEPSGQMLGRGGSAAKAQLKETRAHGI